MNGRTARCANTLVITSMLLSCGGDNTPSQVQAPGAGESAKTQALEAGADVLQDKEPLQAFNAYLDGFHFASGCNVAGLSLSPALGELLAAWILDGAPPLDLEPLTLARFAGRIPPDDELRRDAAWQYRHFYGAA